MNAYVLSILTAIFANVFYHLCLKFTSPMAHPLAALSVSYATACILCLTTLFLVAPGPFLQQYHHLNWASFALGISICGLELGFLFAYRAGWNLSVAALFCNVAVGIILLPIGLLFFRERLSPHNMIGIVLAMVGLFLIGKR